MQWFFIHVVFFIDKFNFKKGCVFLFLWFFFMITNFQKWVHKENVCLFIHMILFYAYKISKMGISKILT